MILFSFFLALLAISVGWIATNLQTKSESGPWRARVSVKRIEKEIQNLPLSCNGTKIVLLSDIHWGEPNRPRIPLITPSFLDDVIEKANQERPDLVFLLGDLTNNSPETAPSLAQKLKKLTPRLGVFGVLGNHDEGFHGDLVGRESISEVLKANNIQILLNEVRYPLGPGVQVVGLGDLWAKQFLPKEVMPGLDPSLPTLVLSHNPDTAVPLKNWKVDLQFSGHTHGGQIYLPFLGPLLPFLVNTAKMLTPGWLVHKLPWMRFGRVLKYMEFLEGGLYELKRMEGGSNWMYVNEGLAISGPVRLATPPEMTVVTLKSPDQF